MDSYSCPFFLQKILERKKLKKGCLILIFYMIMKQPYRVILSLVYLLRILLQQML